MLHPTEHDIERVMRETGMDRLPAIRHLQGRALAMAAHRDRQNQQLRRIFA